MMLFTFTEAGQGHTNEDAIAYRQHPADSEFIVCALADGQGGRSGGGAAARMAVSVAIDAACAVTPGALLSPSTWLDICSTADRSVATAPDAGFCTLVALVTKGEWVVGASSGDSAAAQILEHTAVILTERQQKNPPVGSSGAKFEPFSARATEKQRILIVSDGVWKYAGWEQMITIGRSEQGSDVASKLRREVLQLNGSLPDDFSIIVIES